MVRTIFQSVLVFSFCLHIFVLGKAGINIVADNKCPKSLTYKLLSEDQSEESLLESISNSTQDLHYISTGYFKDRKVLKSVQVLDENKKVIASLKLSLSNKWAHNMFEVSEIHGDIAVDHLSLKWKNYYGTPSLTITACPTHVTNIDGSMLDGVDRVVIFGDSLSDKGTLHEVSLGLIPDSRHYYDGMFSNGPVWTMLLERDLHALKKRVKVSNYSVGGTTAVFHFNLKDLPYSIKGQRDFFDKNAKEDKWTQFDRFLNVIFIGANDYTEASPQMSQEDLDETTNQVISAIKDHVDGLISDYNMEKFVLITLPNLGLTPKSKKLANAEITEKLTNVHNQKLADLVAQYKEKYPNKTFQLVDIGPIFRDMVLNTEELNQQYDLAIQDHSTPCWTGGYFENQNDLDAYLKEKMLPKSLHEVSSHDAGLCQNPEQHIFFDQLHPTKQIHRTLYLFIMGALGVSMLNPLVESEPRDEL